MVTILYAICLAISILTLFYMAFKNYDNINTYYWTIVILLPICILAYFLKTRIVGEEAARVLFCFVYLDSTVLLTVIIFSMVYALGIKIKPWEKVATYVLAFGYMTLIWTCMDNQLYYKSIDVLQAPSGSITVITNGPLKFIHIIYLALVLMIVATILITGFVRKGSYSRKNLFIYLTITALALILYGIEIFADLNYSLLPFLYAVGSVFVAFDYDRAHMHDITSLISEQQDSGNKIYLAFDRHKRFVSCNEKAYDFIPGLNNQLIDEKLNEDAPDTRFFNDLIEKYDETGRVTEKHVFNGITCACEVNSFSIRKSGAAQGYIIDIRDATEEQKVLDVMTSYNETLNSDINKITEHVKEMQQKIVIGMANIIENRDDNTGGHVKRTSEVMKIIVDEINRQGEIKLGEQLAIDIVRAAPMHDLGKISIDSSILCKPDKLTKEEFEIMKTHAVKSGEMVHIILDGVEEEHFVKTAFNIACYHHERWNGKGYPEGLVGTMIPIEARIMAVADVYDALVSKRCYKEAMSFDEARSVMCDGMGSQFDPNLKKVFLGCCDKLEAYYSSES